MTRLQILVRHGMPLALASLLIGSAFSWAEQIQLPEPFATPSVRNSASRIDRPQGTLPSVPSGFSVELYAEGLPGVRTMLQAPNGDILIAQRGPGAVVVLPADTAPEI